MPAGRRRATACDRQRGGCAVRASSRVARGYTLLELLVVLSILGLVTALAAPPLIRTVSTWQRQSDIDLVMEQVRGLPMRARAGGRTLVVDDASLQGTESPLRAPDGWSLSATAPWVIHSNGVCEPGELMLRRDDREVPIVVHAPFCQPRRPALDDGGPGP
ncbi:MAG: type II secretion system protein [Xanthomonadaceae bacterium]|nr:type II secretion system protein [Xanthomonadaceae bacterium]